MTREEIVQSGTSKSIGAQFPIKAVRIDNETNQWLQITGTLLFVNPYTVGFVANLRGVGSVTLGSSPPPGVTNPAVITAEAYSVTVYDTPQAESPGVSVPVRPATAIFVAQGVGQKELITAAAWTDVLTALQAGLLEVLGGVKRMLIKAGANNAALCYVAVGGAGLAAPPPPSFAFELAPGDGIVIPYRYWAASVAPPNTNWGQYFIVNGGDIMFAMWAV